MIAYGLAKYKLGKALMDAVSTRQGLALTQSLAGWRNSLRDVLRKDPKGFLERKYSKLADLIGDSFPDLNVLRHYAGPLMTFSASDGPVPQPGQLPCTIESCQPCLGTLAAFCMQHLAGEKKPSSPRCAPLYGKVQAFDCCAG
jgi:hypothetical protein